MASHTAMKGLLLLAAAMSAVADVEVQKPMLDEHSAVLSPAKLVLYAGSRIHPEDLAALNKETRACSDGDSKTEIDLDLNTCLSGDYYLYSNLKITSPPACPDGSTPFVSFYNRRRCVGEARSRLSVSDKAGSCLTGSEIEPSPVYYWSMIFSCPTSGWEGVEQHQAAIPPAITHQFEGGLLGAVHYWTGTHARCGETNVNGGPNLGHPMLQDVDVCAWPLTSWEYTALTVTHPPICPNGTRAMLARFEDTGESDFAYRRGMCNGGKMTFEDGLVDINDDDIGDCIGMNGLALNTGGVANAKGAMWYCAGLDLSRGPTNGGKANVAQTANAVVSHNACRNDYPQPWSKAARRPTTFFDVPVDTCVDNPDSQDIRLVKAGVCADGSVPMLAKWRGRGCRGMPDTVAGVFAGPGLYCQHFDRRAAAAAGGDSSYSFWCDGARGSGDRLRQPRGDRRAVFSSDVCKPKDGMWSPERHAGLAETVKRIEPDRCIDYFSRDTEWTVYANAVCPNGRPARMAVWEGESGCRGKPTSVRAVRKGDLGRCVEACGAGKEWYHKCSRAFICDGIPAPRGRKNLWYD